MAELKSWGTTWLVVTGASRGLGASICEGMAKYLGDESVMLGIARSQKGLDSTEQKVKAINPRIKFTSVSADLGELSADDVRQILKSSLKSCEKKSFDKAMIVHNAGSLGALDYLRDVENVDFINKYYNFNISSVLSLNTLFLKEARSLQSQPKIHILHISSLCAVQPIKSWGMYCVGKAGRDMMFRMIALEEEDVTVLNYAPGPLDNEMQEQIHRDTADPEIKKMFVEMKRDNKLLPCEVSVEKLIKILIENKFKSGDHVDYYDEL